MIAAPSQAAGTVTGRRVVARKFYRVITLAACPLALIALLPTAWVQRDPLIGIMTLIWMAVPLLIAPGLAVLALIGGVRLARDWRFALPAWLYLAAIALVVVDQFLFSGEVNLWTAAGVLMGVSLVAAAWAGWWLKIESGLPSEIRKE